MLEKIKKNRSVSEVLSLLSKPAAVVELHPDAAPGLGPLLALLHQELRKPLLYIGSSEERTRVLFGDCALFAEKVRFFPAKEASPFEDPVSSGERLAVLEELLRDILFVFSTPAAILQETRSPFVLKESRMILRAGEIFLFNQLLERLEAWGYARKDLVHEKKEFSVRGGIVDLFPLAAEEPLRIEWYGDEIDSIRVFNPSTQRSTKKVESFELFSPETIEQDETAVNGATLLDYLPGECVVIIEGMDEWDGKFEFLRDWVNRHSLLKLSNVSLNPSVSWPFASVENFTHRFPEFLQMLSKEAGREIYLFTRQASRLKEVLDEGNIHGIEIFPSPLSQGFSLPEERIFVYTDRELFGRVVSRFRRIAPSRPVALEELQEGDVVVHTLHGIARFESLVPLDVQGSKQDYLALSFRGNDRLYVPLEEMCQVERYVGPPGRIPILSKLGGGEWKKAKSKARKAAEEIASDLVELYAARSRLPGHACSSDTPWQREMEEAFPFEETPDQDRAVKETKVDMEKPGPMDRLIVGDVGYGKTEVALRAGFKAVMDGFQVAVLVPTTILAQQHYETFSERLATFPIKVEMLSRFKSKKEQEEILLRIFSGEIDILIGTHRLLQRDVSFKNLGLLIVDEEQRFGVAHKEALKKLKASIDCLTLSATPIPRTFYLSLMGVRDISVIDTPPGDRLPVKTFVAEKDPQIIRRAVLQELERNGQVYYLYNRVEKLAEKESELAALLPEARMITAHGQLKGEKLENVMWEFMKGFYNLLLCTTIIENGLDIPNVNTLIVENADRFGLAQLYQIRGRVGRSDRQAYAYFFTSPRDRLNEDARRRLEAIQEFTQLGSGYTIALRDLEIRGAGNLLGLRQHGHVAALGYHLYCQILADEVKKQKGEKPPPAAPNIQIDLPVAAFIPEEYIPVRSQKLELYKRLSLCKNFEEIDEIQDEILDRFGDPPAEVENLFRLVGLRVSCLFNHVYEIKLADREAVVRFWDGRKELRIPFDGGFPVKVGFDLLQSKIAVIQ